MEIQKKKKRIVSSTAALISIGVHVGLIVVLGGVVALKFYKKQGAGFAIEDQKPKLERRKLQMPVKTQPFVEQMTKPKLQTTSRITANAPQMVNIPEQSEYVKMAPMPTFKAGYTNFVQMDRTLEFNSKYRDVSFGISAVDFFGTRGKAEKVVVVVDTSKSMLYDTCGGIGSYQMVHEDLKTVIGNMRSATLFDVVLFDGNKVSLFNPALVPATPTAKTNVLEWIGGINTNLARVGLGDDAKPYVPRRQYDIPMDPADLSGWLKGFQAAVELKPEIIFVLSSEWGSVTSMEKNISYFLKQQVFAEYQKKRAEYFLQNEDNKAAMETFFTEYDQMRAVALKMLELENQARIAQEMQPKVVRDWDEILYDNDIELPKLPLAMEQAAIGIRPVETRYTLDEVLESFFKIVMDNYRNRGFPQINFVMLQAKDYSPNTAEAAAGMTSDAKFKMLAKMVGGRFRPLPGMPKVGNVLDQNLSDVIDQIDTDTPEEL